MSSPAPILLRREQLSPHPLLSIHPTACAAHDAIRESARPDAELALQAQKWANLFLDSTAELGILDALDVCERTDEPGSYWILDGRHRVEGSRAQEFTCRVHPADDAETIIAAKLLDRRHISKEQMACFIIATWPELATAERRGGRPPKNLSKSDRFSLAGFAERYDVSLDALTKAKSLYLLALKKDCLHEVSVKVWSGKGLGALVAGIAGGESTRGKPRPATDFVGRAQSSVKSFCHTFAKWDNLADRERAAVTDQVVTLFKHLPPSVRQAIDKEVWG